MDPPFSHTTEMKVDTHAACLGDQEVDGESGIPSPDIAVDAGAGEMTAVDDTNNQNAPIEKELGATAVIKEDDVINEKMMRDQLANNQNNTNNQNAPIGEELGATAVIKVDDVINKKMMKDQMAAVETTVTEGDINNQNLLETVGSPPVQCVDSVQDGKSEEKKVTMEDDGLELDVELEEDEEDEDEESFNYNESNNTNASVEGTLEPIGAQNDGGSNINSNSNQNYTVLERPPQRKAAARARKQLVKVVAALDHAPDRRSNNSNVRRRRGSVDTNSNNNRKRKRSQNSRVNRKKYQRKTV